MCLEHRRCFDSEMYITPAVLTQTSSNGPTISGNVLIIDITVVIKQNTKSCTYVWLYGSGLFNFGSYVSHPAIQLN